ncbi:MAG: hypothetical protein QOD40_1300 [Alphaproteobacteria bacterium]|jgi:hypothetical protein|nr:hypothetical protein [Alphaproteobacteria bacterium]
MPIIEPGNDGRFEIMLPNGASAAQLALKARFDTLREPLTAKLGMPDYQPLLQRLQDAARLGFDGENGAAANPEESLIRLGSIQTDTQRLDARPGRFVIVMPPAADPDRGREIVFQVIGGATPVPTDQLELYADITDTLTTLEVILPPGAAVQPDAPPTNRFDQYRVKLFSLAQVGLQGSADAKAARQGLNALQAEILTREGPRVKNSYMKTLGAWATLFAAIVFVAYFIVRWFIPPNWLLYQTRNTALLWVGTMAGVWLSFGVRRAILNLKDLSNLEADKVEPAIRLIFTGVIAIIIELMFICGMVNIDVGGLHSAQLLIHGTQALLIGALLGISEQAIPGALTKRASQFVSDLGGKA